YLRRNPKVVFNSFIGDEHEEIFLSNENFTFAYKIENSWGEIYRNPRIMELTAAYFHMKYNETSHNWDTVFSNKIKHVNCTDLPNVNDKEKYYGVSLAGFNCLDFNTNNVI